MAERTGGRVAKKSLSREDTRRSIIEAELARLNLLHGKITPDIVVTAASAEENPLHDEFEWDNAKAAHQGRLQTARQLITYVTVTIVHRSEKITVPYYVRDPNAGPKEQGYVSLGAAELRRQDAETVMLREFDRCKSAIERARGISGVLDDRYPGIQDELNGLLERVVLVRARIEDRREENAGLPAAPPPA